MSRVIRRRSARWAAVLVSAATLAGLATSAQAAPLGLAARSASVGLASTNLAASPDTGASDISNLGSGGWAVQSSAVATQTGAQISTPGFQHQHVASGRQR